MHFDRTGLRAGRRPPLVQLRRIVGIAVAVAAFCYAAAMRAQAGLTPQEQDLWGASKDAPLAFTVSVDQAPAVMARAAAYIAQWRTYDRYMYAMNLKISTPNLVKTFDPNGIGTVGFTVRRADFSTTNGIKGSTISVETSHYSRNFFGNSDQAHDAQKRGRLLAYLLETYASSLPGAVVPTNPAAPAAPAPPPIAPPAAHAAPVAPSIAPPAPEAPGPSPDRVQALVDLLRGQVAAGQYADALKTIDSLKSAVAARVKQGTSQSTH